MSIFDIFSSKDTRSFSAGIKGENLVKYQHFRALLNHNHNALSIMAEMEQLYFGGKPFDAIMIKRNYEALFEHLLGLAKSLNAISSGRFQRLADKCRTIDGSITDALKPRQATTVGEMVLPLEAIGSDLQSRAGAKATNLAIMKNILKLPVPEGFIITSEAFECFLEGSGLKERIHEWLARVSPGDFSSLEAASAAIRQMVLDAEVPPEIANAIVHAYEALEKMTLRGVRIALRSSAVGEDTEASFAGQYTTVLNITRKSLLDAYKHVVASKYSPRALAYRQMLGLEDEDTPMCVIGLAMVDARASGVMYTVDPATMDAGTVQISSIWGLGEQLVSGNASPDTFVVSKKTGEITARLVAAKAEILTALETGGTLLKKTDLEKQSAASISDDTVRKLAEYSVQIEQHYESPQDIEWAVDASDTVFLLQARPLHVALKVPELTNEDLSGAESVLATGVGASYGIAFGTVFIAKNEKTLASVPDRAILVTKNASPNYAEVMGRISGLITDIGSITSHLSSVAREFGVPAIVNAGNATEVLRDAEVITMAVETQVAVYRGIVEPLVSRMRPAKKLIVNSPVHRKLQTMLEYISPLHLTDADAPSFSIDGCRTFHDVIRFCHEHSMREMFGLSSQAEGTGASVKLVTHIPLVVYAIDLGGGLRNGLTTRDSVTPDDITSHPMKAIWKGFTHPGISWSGTVNFDVSNFMTLMASTATSEFGPAPGGDSYALLATDYMNFSAKFGYHFATLDALCSDNSNHNYVSLQFSGGAGDYFGRSLRVQFLGTVLERLGFLVKLKGDLLEASFNRYDRDTIFDKLDHLGRLLATSRLLDVALSNQNNIQTLTEAFFNGDYDFLRPRDNDQPSMFYSHLGRWQCKKEGSHDYLVQDGLDWRGPLSGKVYGLIGKTFGSAYQEFLDTIGAYYYFPIAIAKNGEMGNGTVTARVKPESGSIDRAGGILFGLRNIANYYVFRINALEDNAILFQFVNNKRVQLKSVPLAVSTNAWYRLRVEIVGSSIKCWVNDGLLLEYTADDLVKGHVGLWTKADSVTWFETLTIADANGVRTIGC
ncbi:MAG TPA: PEP/pyruvate-binding domain-containing protein [Dissulfurispiraceae bacterium]|nr:PEP/pyruvate-binding domain-containing protein [Dissulfurispiraceae bacterium]